MEQVAQGTRSALSSVTLLVQGNTCRRKDRFLNYESHSDGARFCPLCSCEQPQRNGSAVIRVIDGWFWISWREGASTQHLKLTGPKLALIKTSQSSNAARTAPKPLCVLRLGWERCEYTASRTPQLSSRAGQTLTNALVGLQDPLRPPRGAVIRLGSHSEGQKQC